MDDSLGHTVDWNKHLEMLREFHTKIRVAGLTLRPSKCMIGYFSLDFVGHVVGQGSLAVN